MFFRHLRLYLWKNGLQKARQGGNTFCEFCTPVVLVALFAWLYTAVNLKTFPDTTYECDYSPTTVAKSDMVYLPRALNMTSLKLGLVGPFTVRSQFQDFLSQSYPGLSAQALQAMNCTAALNEVTINGAPASFPAFTPDLLLQWDTEAEMEAYTQTADYGMNGNNPALYAAVVFSPDASVSGIGVSSQWTYKVRANVSYIPDTRTLTDELQRGVNLAVIQQYMYASPFQSGDSTHQLGVHMPGFIPLQTAVDKFIIQRQDPAAVNGLDLAGFYALWGCIPNDPTQLILYSGNVTSFLTSTSLLPQRVNVVPMPTTAYTENDFYTFVQNVFALMFVLSFFFPSFFLIRGMVQEKETKIREGMRMMGMGDLALFSAWYITYAIIFFFIALAISVTTAVTFFSHSDGGLIFLYFWLFGLTAIALGFMLSTFFGKAKLASAVGAVLFIAAFFPYFTVNDPLKPQGVKLLASLLSPVSFGLALDILATLEGNGVGLTWATINNVHNDFTFSNALGMMVLDFLLYTVLGWYLGNVLPQEFGLPQPFYFCCTRSYWCGTPQQRAAAAERGAAGCCRGGRRGGYAQVSGSDGSSGSSSGGGALSSALLTAGDSSYTAVTAGSLNSSSTDKGRVAAAGGHSDSGMAERRFEQIGLASGEHIEAVGPALRDLAREGRALCIRELVKEFETPDGTKRAVDRLNLDMFEGQIFALLGHNGAGKTTTISMLTGLIPPTSGDAYVNGLPISSDMASVRASMGVCPQHDVLWPDLTVKEHLQYFAGIKGMDPKTIDAAVMEMIREVGLVEKINYRSSDLSGGQKRKLSVGIALIGGSKLVVLDEPSSGVDPFSRRSLWQTLQNAREGRIIILTTHFMDEADVLGDRIGIMANGQLRVCGSSMFLKRKYGVGYNITIIKAEGCDSAAVITTVARHVQDARVLSNVGTELSFQAPLAASAAFPALFAELENNAQALRVVTYGVSVTTLEEVFLKVAEEGHDAAHESPSAEEEGAGAGAGGAAAGAFQPPAFKGAGADHDGDAEAGESLLHGSKAGAAGQSAASQQSVHLAAAGGNKPAMGLTGSNVVDSYNRSLAQGRQGTASAIFWRHFKALFIKRFKNALRDKRAMLFQLLIPVVALLVGLLLLHQVNTNTFPALTLGMQSYNTALRPTAAQAAAGSSAPPNFIPFLASASAAAFVPFITSSGNGQPAAGSAQGNSNGNAGAAYNSTFITIPPSALYAAYPPSGYVASNSDCNGTSYLDYGLLPNWGRELLQTGFNTTDVWAVSEWLLQMKKNQTAGQDLFSQMGASTYASFALHSINPDPSTGAQPNPLPGTAASAAYSVLVNTTALHIAPAAVAIMDSALYNWATGGSNASITVIDAPLPFTQRQGLVVSSITSFVAVLFIVIAFSFIPSSFAVFIVKEREVAAKHQQLISGVSIPAYWLSTYAWDIINYAVPCIVAIILVLAFDVTELVKGESLVATILLFFFYGTSVASFTYCTSYLFSSHSTAQIMTLILNLLCVVLLLASFVMQQIDSTCPADASLKFVYRLIPGFSLGNGLLQLSLLAELPFLETNCGKLGIFERVQQKFTAFSPAAAGWPLVFMVLESVIYFLLAILIDILLSYPALRARLFPDKNFADKPYAEDEDVIAETQRVDSGRADNDVIILQHLRKVYAGGKVAVRNLSFGIPRGEVFGFLGINGAGKTTTLKILSGDIIPTVGTARLGGLDILQQQMEVRRLLGYCPQFDALLELLTPREHLELFARIKGVPEEYVPSVVEAKLREMDLVQYANKLAGSLSGGNKRKLSVAIAMIGDPQLIFLDEPSTGVDPVARRFMWGIISKIATERRQCSVILTTHSMEECEALCTRVGIMVGGRLRCLGSTQHLKNKYGKGYLAVIKLSTPSAEHMAAVLQHADRFLEEGKLRVGSLMEACSALGDPIRARMVHPQSSGWHLASSFQKEGYVEAAAFAEWWAAESLGAQLHAFMQQTFPGCGLVERHGEFFRYKLPDTLGTGMPLSAVFGCIESQKQRLRIQEYSLSQTTLEQIFNTFAAQQEEETGSVRGMASAPTPDAAGGAAGARGGAGGEEDDDDGDSYAAMPAEGFSKTAGGAGAAAPVRYGGSMSSVSGSSPISVGGPSASSSVSAKATSAVATVGRRIASSFSSTTGGGNIPAAGGRGPLDGVLSSSPQGVELLTAMEGYRPPTSQGGIN